MSASLVGSEMCIRDRRAAGHPQQGASPTSSGAARESERAAGLQGDLPETVSYTHLTLPTICSV
eukprot:5259929-Alexandrium_andersonii.AAC.1